MILDEFLDHSVANALAIYGQFLQAITSAVVHVSKRILEVQSRFRQRGQHGERGARESSEV